MWHLIDGGGKVGSPQNPIIARIPKLCPAQNFRISIRFLHWQNLNCKFSKVKNMPITAFPSFDISTTTFLTFNQVVQCFFNVVSSLSWLADPLMAEAPPPGVKSCRSQNLVKDYPNVWRWNDLLVGVFCNRCSFPQFGTHRNQHLLLLAWALIGWMVTLGHPFPIPAERFWRRPALPSQHSLWGWRYPSVHNHAILCKGSEAWAVGALPRSRVFARFGLLVLSEVLAFFGGPGSLWGHGPD